MKYFGLILIPLVLALFLGGPGCSQSQDEPAVTMEQAPEKAVEVPVVEEAEKVVVEVEEVEVEVEAPVADAAEAEEAGKSLLDQAKEKGEEEAGEQIEQVEIEEVEVK